MNNAWGEVLLTKVLHLRKHQQLPDLLRRERHCNTDIFKANKSGNESGGCTYHQTWSQCRLSNNAQIYLNTMIKEEELEIFNRHILDSWCAYPIMIFAWSLWGSSNGPVKDCRISHLSAQSRIWDIPLSLSLPTCMHGVKHLSMCSQKILSGWRRHTIRNWMRWGISTLNYGWWVYGIRHMQNWMTYTSSVKV